jgi:hypothetical protein
MGFSFRSPDDTKQRLLALLNSRAVRKLEVGCKDEIGSADVFRFWDITQYLKGAAVDWQVAQVGEFLRDLEQELASVDVELATGRVVTAADIRALLDLHNWMMERFSTHLNLLRSRSAER